MDSVEQPVELEAALDAAEQRIDEAQPFALTEDSEMGAAKAGDDPLDEESVDDSATEILPACAPGSEGSPFRHCSCLGVFPGRVCVFCNGTRWTKTCPQCDGMGRIVVQRSTRFMRSSPCGFCMSRGVVSASLAEVEDAESQARTSVGVESITAVPKQRAAHLPGVGVTEHKRGNTLNGKRRDAERNEFRKLKYAAQKRIGES